MLFLNLFGLGLVAIIVAAMVMEIVDDFRDNKPMREGR